MLSPWPALKGSAKPVPVLRPSAAFSPWADTRVATGLPNLSSRPGDVSRRLSPNSPKRITAVSPAGCSSQIWWGRDLEPRESGPPREVAAGSRAPVLVPPAALHALGRLCPAVLLYHHDVELALPAPA